MQALLRVSARFPLISCLAVVMACAFAVAQLAPALAWSLPGDIGVQAILNAAFIFALCTLVAALVGLPFRASGLVTLGLAFVLALATQILLFEVLGTILGTEAELARNRGFMHVGLVLEGLCALVGLTVWAVLVHFARRKEHAV